MDFAEIVRSPWKSSLRRWAGDASNTVRVAAPFIKLDAANTLLASTPHGVDIRVLTNFRLHSFERGVSDLDALWLLKKRGVNLRTSPRLHAKLYIFDDNRAIVTSGNLTKGGLTGNIEYGVAVTKKETVREIARDFDSWFGARGKVSEIKDDMLTESRRILDSLPKADRSADAELTKQQKRLIIPESDDDDAKFAGGADAIKAGLTGWKLQLFSLLDDEIRSSSFALSDAYRLVSILEELYPGNLHVEDKIRQTLQFLRDLGLLEFYGKGQYRKLW